MKSELCLRKADLLNACQQADVAYAQAVIRLERTRKNLTRQEYESAHWSLEELRIRARHAKEQLDNHVAQHSC